MPVPSARMCSAYSVYKMIFNTTLLPWLIIGFVKDMDGMVITNVMTMRTVWKEYLILQAYNIILNVEKDTAL